jgi:hypothetical protein
MLLDLPDTRATSLPAAYFSKLNVKGVQQILALTHTPESTRSVLTIAIDSSCIPKSLNETVDDAGTPN